MYNDKLKEQIQENIENLLAEYSYMTRTMARKIVRRNLNKVRGYQAGNIGASPFAHMASRQERRADARLNKTPFEPVLNNF